MKQGKRPHARFLQPEEKDLWDHVTQTVRRTSLRPSSPKEAIEDQPDRRNAAPRRRAVMPPPVPVAQKRSEPLSHGATQGMDGRTAMRMKRGKLDIHGRLDLHGHTQRAAHQALETFLSESFHRDRRTVLVITGKGDPVAGRPGVLKDTVPRWLNEMPMRQWVTGFSYAAVKDGGEGALYVRIKRRRT